MLFRKRQKILREHGRKDNKGIQKADGITNLPQEYFNPLNSATRELHVTELTHLIHWLYSKLATANKKVEHNETDI